VRHVRMLGLCLVAAFAVGAYVTSSAMAGPQWVKCESTSELEAVGYPFEAKQVKYVNKDCTEKSPKEAREYVLLKAPEVENLRVNYLHVSANVPFSGGSGQALLSTSALDCSGGEYSAQRVPRETCINGGGKVNNEEGLSVECEEETNEGEAVSKNKLENIEVTFTGCLIAGEIPCNSAGAEELEIKTNTLKGKLGYIEPEGKVKHEAGILLEPQTKKGTFAEFECLFGLVLTTVGQGNKKEGAFYVKGTNYPEGCGGICPGATPEEEKKGGYDGIISTIVPVNKMTPTFEQKFVTNKSELEPQNIPSKLENKHIDLLEDYVEVEVEGGKYADIMWTAASEELTNVNTVGEGEEAEIKA
jgi:hypothetical protein